SHLMTGSDAIQDSSRDPESQSGSRLLMFGSRCLSPPPGSRRLVFGHDEFERALASLSLPMRSAIAGCYFENSAASKADVDVLPFEEADKDVRPDEEDCQTY